MARRLFVVEDSFLLKGRGLVLAPGIIPRGEEQFHIGDSIQLRRPDGTSLDWKIGGIEMINCVPPREDVVIMLKGLSKQDVPLGTEVWSVDPDPRIDGSAEL